MTTSEDSAAIMEEINKKPSSLQGHLTICKIDSLAHVNPWKNYPEAGFYYEERSEVPTMDEVRQQQPRIKPP